MEQESLNRVYRFDQNPSARAERLRKEARGTPHGVRRDDLLRRAKRIALPHGGKEELKRLTGITGPTINALLGSGKAHPATIERLRAAFEKQNGEAA